MNMEVAMIDSMTHQPLYVSTEGSAGPYIMVPVAQLEKVREVLKSEKVPHWVDEEAISLDGKPEVTVINLGTQTKPAVVQNLLDQIP